MEKEPLRKQKPEPLPSGAMQGPPLPPRRTATGPGSEGPWAHNPRPDHESFAVDLMERIGVVGPNLTRELHNILLGRTDEAYPQRRRDRKLKTR